MIDQDRNNQENLQQGPSEEGPFVETDAAIRSLSEALRISFVILKIIMVVLVVLFLASGLETVGPGEQAIVLRFGKIRGVGEAKILKPRARPYWVFPYPIEEMIKIPVGTMVDLSIRTFWYYQSEQELLEESQGKRRAPRNDWLDPVKDGYCLTRSPVRADEEVVLGGSDYNIVHSKWQLIYQVADPELFFKNVYVKDLKPGQVYLDVMTESVEPLLKSILENAVAGALVNYTIDEAVKSQDTIRRSVEHLVREKLNSISEGETENICGIKVVSVYLTDITWPRQVDEAFQAAHKASQASQKAISEARTYAQKVLNQTAGPVAESLYEALHDAEVEAATLESLWAQSAGDVQEKLVQARAYATRVEAAAKANADYFLSLLPEYRKHPEITIQSIYREAIERVLEGADEKFIIQPTEGEEIRIHLSRDPEIRRKRARQRASEKAKEQEQQ